MDVKLAVAARGNRAVLDECERDEAAAEKDYRGALAQNLPAGARAVVGRQCAEIQRARQHLREIGRELVR